MTVRGREITGQTVSLSAAWTAIVALLALLVWLYGQHETDMARVRVAERDIEALRVSLAQTAAQTDRIEGRQIVNQERISRLEALAKQ